MPRRERDAEIRRLAKEVIGEVAPEDLPLFDDQADAYFAHRGRFHGKSHHGGPNEFAGDVVTAVLIIIVLKTLNTAVDVLIGRTVESVGERIWQWLRRRSRRRRIEPTLDMLITEALKAYPELGPERAAQLTAAIKIVVLRHWMRERQDGSG